MSDYAKITNFTAKDALSTGDPAKAVKGVELDAELAAISVAVGTKFDSADLASQADAEAGTDNAKLMTPLRVAQALASFSAQALYKTAAETVNNSSTLQNDDHLASFAIAASGVYRVSGVLHFAVKAASDLKLCLTLGSAPTTITVQIVGIEASTGTMVRGVQSTNGSAVAITTGSDQIMLVVVEGIIVNDTDATTMTLQWAQNSAQSENLTLAAGSYLVVDKVA